MNKILRPHANTKAALTETPLGLEIRIRAPRSIWPILFLPFWLTMWAIGWVVVAWGLVTWTGDTPAPFAMLWLVLWTAGGVFAFSAWLWFVSGREVVVIDGTRLRVRREVTGFARERAYALSDLTNMRFSPPVTPDNNFAQVLPLAIFSGSIGFDVGGQTKRFGMYLDETESNRVVDEVTARWPSLAAPRRA